MQFFTRFTFDNYFSEFLYRDIYDLFKVTQKANNIFYRYFAKLFAFYRLFC